MVAPPVLASTHWPLTGRRAELAMALGLLRQPDAAGLIIAGAAGVGKSRLASEVARGVEPSDYIVARVVANEWTSQVPFGAFAPLLGEVPDGLEPATAFVWVRHRLLSKASTGPRLLLVVDDAHLLDGASAALLLDLVTRRAAAVVATVRSGPSRVPEALVALWKDELVVRLDLQPLSRHEIADLVDHLLPGVVDPVTHVRLWERCRGNPLLLREILASAAESDNLQRLDGVWRWDGQLDPAAGLVEAIDERVGALSGDERHAASLLAVTDALPLDLLRSLVDADALDALARRGVIRIDEPAEGREGAPPTIRFSHPLFSEVLRSTTPSTERRLHARRLIAALEANGAAQEFDVVRLATLYLAAGQAGDPSVMAAAARRAVAMGDVALGERLGEAALAADPASLTAALALADVHQHRHQPVDVETRLAPFVDIVSTDTDRLAVGVRRATALFEELGRRGEAEAILRAAEEAIADPAVAALARIERARIDVMAGNWAGARALAYPLAASPPTAASLQALLVPGVLCLLSEGRATAALELCERAARAAGTLSSDARSALLRLLVLCLSGHLGEAAKLSGELLDAAAPWSEGRAAASLHEGVLGLLTGNIAAATSALGTAASLLRQADPAGLFVWALAFLAQARAAAGDAAGAGEVLAEIDRRWSAHDNVFAGSVGLARVWAAAAAGDVGRARHVAGGLADHCAAVANRFEEMLALHAAVRLGAATMGRRLATVAARVDGPLAQAIEAEGTGVASSDPRLVRHASDAYVELGALLLAAEASARAAALYRRSGSGLEADAAAQRSRQLAAECPGARTPALLLAPDLTAREHEIVVLAAQGLSNRDISERLDLQVRTVEGHLNRVYAKLGVRTRHELRERLIGTA